jgi:hypothetical protein
MTVTEVLLNFRSALLSVVPAFEKVALPWCMPDAYDEWDDAATALYQALVVEVLRRPEPEREHEHFRLPAYDMMLTDYSQHCLLEVLHPSLDKERHVFHSFGTEVLPLDRIRTRRVLPTGRPMDGELISCPVEGAAFRLLLGSAGKPAQILLQIVLPG